VTLAVDSEGSRKGIRIKTCSQLFSRPLGKLPLIWTRPPNVVANRLSTMSGVASWTATDPDLFDTLRSTSSLGGVALLGGAAV
jgi:hypothetical protein